jgi:hypothetical protein
MNTWLLIGALALGVLILLWIARPVDYDGGYPTAYEDFLTLDPDEQLAQRQQLQFEGERRFNDLARLQAPATKLSSDMISAAVAGPVAVSTIRSPSLLSLLGSSMGLGGADDGSGKVGSSVEQTGVLQDKINFCESLTTVNCDQLSDPRLAECGFCHRDGVNSKGAAHRGGMYISSDDQIRANEVSNAGGAVPALYKPTIGSCDSRNFTLTSDNCKIREAQLVCQSAGAATAANQCGQCYGAAPAGATGLLFVGPKPRSYTATLWVSHPGAHAAAGAGLIVKQANGTVSTLPYSRRPVLDPAQLTLTVTEGDTMTITVYGAPAVWCGWLSSVDGTRTVSLDIGEQSISPTNGFVIAGDKRASTVTAAVAKDSDLWASFQNQIPNAVMWYQRRSEGVPGAVTAAWYGSTLPDANGAGPGVSVTDYVKMAAGQGQDIPVQLASLPITDPAPGVQKYLWIWQDTGNLQSFADGTTVSNSLLNNTMQMTFTVPATLVDPVFSDDKADCPSGPMVFTEVGAGLMGAHSCFKPDGSFNPTAYCLQELFQAAGGTPQGSDYPTTDAAAAALVVNGTLDDTVAALNARANIALYGVDANGGPVDFATFKDASMRMFGTVPKNPCDGPNAQTGPHSAECLDYLWRTAGATVDGAITDPTTIPYQYCSAAGTDAPLGAGGAPNTAAVATANSYQSIPNIRGYYKSIFDRTQNNSDFEAQASAMKSCFNVAIQQPPPKPFGCVPEVFTFCPGGGYTLTQGESAAACTGIGARIATPDEIAAAQKFGADSCACAWASDGTAYFPMNKILPAYGWGCGSVGVNNCGQISFSGGVGCVTCYGTKPTKDSAAGAAGVIPFASAAATTGGTDALWNAPLIPKPGMWISITSAAFPGWYLQAVQVFQVPYTSATMVIAPTDLTINSNSSFNIQPARNGAPGYVTFPLSGDFNFSMRNLNGQLPVTNNANTADATFLDDATFAIVPAVNGDPSMFSISTYADPSSYVAINATGAVSPASPSQNYVVVVRKIDSSASASDLAGASWKIQPALAGMKNV